MKSLVIVLLVLGVSACGTTGSKYANKDTRYVSGSKGKAGLIASAFTGDVEYCKATTTDENQKLTLTFDEDGCSITAGTSDD